MPKYRKTNILAKEAMKRLESGFWDAEYKLREDNLTAIKNSGKSAEDAARFWTEQTKAQILSADTEDEELYAQVREVILTSGDTGLLSAVINRAKLENMDDIARQRYILDLSARLQELKNRFYKEQEYNLQKDTITM